MVGDYDNYYHYDIISKTVRTGFGSIIVIRICEYALQQPPRACLPFLLFLLFSRRPKMIIKVIKKIIILQFYDILKSRVSPKFERNTNNCIMIYYARRKIRRKMMNITKIIRCRIFGEIV